MTIGIGGWGSRRKPMAVVRAICRSDLTDLTVVAYGGPDVGLLCATGQGAQGRVRLRHPRLHRARSALARRAPARPGRGHGGRRGDVLPRPAGGVVARALPAHPGRARLRRPHRQPRPAAGALPLRRRTAPTWPIPADADVELVAMPALHLDAAIVHTNRADAAGNGQVLSPDPFFDPLFLGAAERRFMTTEAIVGERRAGRRATTRSPACPSTACSSTAWPRPPAARTSPPTRPTTGATRSSRRSTPPSATDPAEWEAFAKRYVFVERRRVPGPRGGAAGVMTSRIRATPASPAPSPASSPAPTSGATRARSWSAPSAPSPPSAPGWPSAPSRPTSCSPTARPR